MTDRDWSAFDRACNWAHNNLDYRALLLAEHGGKRPPRPPAKLAPLDDETRADLLADAVQDAIIVHGHPNDEFEQALLDETVDRKFAAMCKRRRFELSDPDTQARLIAATFARVLGWRL